MIIQERSTSLPNTSYYPQFLSIEEADCLIDQLLTFPRLTSMLEMEIPGGKVDFEFGKLMFLEEDTYSSGQFIETAWGPLAVFPSELSVIKDRIGSLLNETFAVCIAIYYPNGDSWVDYHADRPAFGDTNIIASISLGAERTFALKENESGAISSEVLGHGSLLIMKDGCQDNYEHSLPKEPECHNPRINLTFRKHGFKK